MKKILLLSMFIASIQMVNAQAYPNPEFLNEIYALRKDSNTLIRLEKDYSKMNTKTKLGGMGGVEHGYTIESERSPVRLNRAVTYSFIYSNNTSNNDPSADSTMRANGFDPSMLSNPTGVDPSQLISLYSVEASKGKRSIIMASGAGMNLLGKAKKESNKYPFSVRKVREGYYELTVDKALPKGEYAFVIVGYGSMDGSHTVFAFGVE
jgi:hypothetical protein